MPLFAYDSKRDKLINILNYRRPKEALAGRKLVCPYYYQVCGKEIEMHIRYRKGYQDHFVHNSHCPYTELHGQESLRHLVAKAAVRALLRRDPFWKAAEFHMEKWEPEAERFPDVLAVFPDGTRIAHECQLSSITRDEIEERNASYEAAGIGVFWWFLDWRWERKNCPPINIYRHQGVGLTISFKEGPNPYRDDAEHRRCRAWPERITLWARYSDSEPRRQLLSPRLEFSHPDQPDDDGAPDDRFLRLFIWTSKPDIALRKRTWRAMLWPPVRRVLKKASTWRHSGEIYDRLAAVWQRHFEPEDVDDFLVDRFVEQGDIVPGPKGGWLLQYLPGFSAWKWRNWWGTTEIEFPERVNRRYSMSARFHQDWWARRLRRARSLDELRQVWEEVRAFERYPEVRDDLRPLYDERLEELEKRRGM